VIKRYYAGIPHLVVLDIEETRLDSDILYEMSPLVNEKFPHVFGPINLDAVVNIHPLTIT
jgi:uncharacterized protein (DUF952 family)